jgi:putative protease
MKKLEICCPAGNLPSLKAAIDNGADVVYLGFQNATNARNFEGLNFSLREIEEGVAYAHLKGKKVFVAINTFPQFDDAKVWFQAVDDAYRLKVDAVILANMGVLRYARDKYPDMNLHLSVQASCSNLESINFYKEHFGVKRVVLPRVMTVDEMKILRSQTDVELEVFALGGLCINVEGRCYLSSYVTGVSCNTGGVCSPSRYVRFDNKEDKLRISLNDILLNELGPGESSPYPTCCKGRYYVDGKPFYAFEDPESLNVMELIPKLADAGIDALKIEGRQRTKSYVALVTKTMREAVDSYYKNPSGFVMKPEWIKQSNSSFEGSAPTMGCYLQK